MKIGMHLKSVHESIQTNKGFAESIKKVSALGYESVLVSSVSPAINAVEIAETCKAYNLEIAGAYVDPTKLLKETDVIIEELQEMNTKSVGFSILPERYPRTQFGFRGFMTDYIPVARQLNEVGIELMYHNHSFEFMHFSKTNAMDYLYDNFAELKFSLDTFWVQAGGGEPTTWINKFAKRINMLCVKDMGIDDGRQVMCEVMNGNLNWPTIFKAAKDANVEYLIVDQSNTYGEDPFECLRTSIQNIKDSGFL